MFVTSDIERHPELCNECGNCLTFCPEHGDPAIVAAVLDAGACPLAPTTVIDLSPMGTGGDSTAMAVNVEYCSGHGFTPVAVAFNCWINRRTRARLHNDGRVEVIE